MYSVDEKLPEIAQDVLVFSSYDNCFFVAYLSVERGANIWIESFADAVRTSINLDEVTLRDIKHWCELPKI